MVFGHRIFWLLFRIVKLIYFPTITNEETYVAAGVQLNRVLALQISPRPTGSLLCYESVSDLFLSRAFYRTGGKTRDVDPMLF